MRLGFYEIVSRLNSSYWFVPALVTLIGAAAAIGLLTVDERVTLDPDSPLALLQPRSPEGARALLSAVIGAMITTISVTFSVTIVALTVAAQHFGPRLLNSFVRQTSAQMVLGTFLATFAYAVLVLGAIGDDQPRDGVPELSIVGAVLLVIVSIGALIYYVHHVSRSLQIGELARDIAADMRNAIVRRDEERTGRGRGGTAPTPPERPRDAAVVCALETGYVQRIDYDTIVALAARRGARIWMLREPGAFVVERTWLAFVYPPDASDDELAGTMARAVIVGPDRTLWHDPEFALKQLVEVALRALSPAVNEPFTALTCIDRLTEGLAEAATAPEPRAIWHDGTGEPRVYVATQSFPTLLRAGFDPIRLFAGVNPAIYARLLESIADLTPVAIRDADRQALRHQAEVIRRTADRELLDTDDRRYVEARYQHAVAGLG
ncbi:MAG TPA: DUF2254 domain-containing protein [Vicinamibacterales bacterium]